MKNVQEIKVARKMVSIGYRWQIVFTGSTIEPLYTKTCGEIGALLRDYPEQSVEILPIRLILKEGK